MKTWKQSGFWGVVAILTIILMTIACGGNDGNDGNESNNGNNGNGNNGGYYVVSNDVCNGDDCRLATVRSRSNHTATEAAQAYDNAIWASWGGGYHDDRNPFSSCGSTYSVNINGKNKAPHFTDNDRLNAENAANQF